MPITGDKGLLARNDGVDVFCADNLFDPATAPDHKQYQFDNRGNQGVLNTPFEGHGSHNGFVLYSGI